VIRVCIATANKQQTL